MRENAGRSDSVSFIGYSIPETVSAKELGETLDRTIVSLYDQGYRVFMTAPSSPFGRMVAGAVAARRKKQAGLRLRIIRGEEEHCDAWDADEVVEWGGDVCDYLVDHAEVVVFCLAAKPRKRAYSVERAINGNKKIINLAYRL